MPQPKRKPNKKKYRNRRIFSASVSHPVCRAKERYDLDLTVADLVSIKNRIKCGDGIKQKTDSDKTEIWLLKINGILCRLVFDPAFDRIITFLSVEQNQTKV